MPLKSVFPDLTIPEKHIISHVFPEHRQPSTTHQWIDAKDPIHTLSSAEALYWAKRFASGLDHEQVPQQTTILLISPNNIFLPAVFYSIVGSGRIFR
jgi:long-subunit acyl-CoA synthetase (AMP-forming)